MIAIVCAAAACLFGCAAGVPHRPVLSSRFYGVWANVNPNINNWWVITAAGAIPYGVPENGTCITGQTVVLASNEIQVNDGTVYLRRAEDLLLMVRNDFRFVSVHKQVKRSEICRKPDGTHAQGAPLAARSP
jgi:hypothetical protein